MTAAALLVGLTVRGGPGRALRTAPAAAVGRTAQPGGREGREYEVEQVTAERRELSNSMAAVLVGYLRRTGGDVLVGAVLEAAGDRRPIAALEDVARWSCYDEMTALFEAALSVTGDPELGRHVGAEVYLRSRPAEVLERLRDLGHPSAVIRYVAETASRQSHITEMATLHADRRNALVSARTLVPFARRHVFCDYTAGMLAAVPTIFSLDLGRVVEFECQTRGDARCLYSVSWEPSPGPGAEAEVELLGRRLERLSTSFETLEEMSAGLVSVGDRDAVLRAIAERAATAVRARRYVLSVRLPRERASRVHSVGFATGDDARAAAELLASPGVHTTGERLVVDVTSSNHSFGSLAAFEPVAGRFLPEEARALQAYAGHAAAVLEATAALADARERAETMSVLFALATELAAVTTREDLARRLARAMHAVADCDAVAVFLWHAATSRLECAGRSRRSGRDGRVEYRPELAIVPDASALVARSTAAPEPVALEDDGSEAPVAWIHRLTGGSHGVAMPVVAQGECFGYVAIGDTAEVDLDRDGQLRERLAGVAGLASSAFLNARLLDDIRHQALHDALTGLPNRALVVDRVEQALARDSGPPPVVLFLDLDGFKEINDTFGHGVGDELLRLVGARLARALPSPSTVGRLGGDEFVVLLEGDLAATGGEPVAARLLAVVREALLAGSVEGLTLSVTASVGVARGPCATADELLRDADVALYEAKAAGKDRAVTFAPAMHEAVMNKLGLEIDLRSALDERQFVLHYQPTLDLATGSVSGVEALVRWRRPGRGLIPPDDFVPVLEDSGLVVPVGRWVLAEACAQGVVWRRRGFDLTVAVNLSARQLESDSIASDVGAALAETGLAPRRLVLELTETALARDPSASVRRLRALRAMGVRIAIDDFGTGYSSLAYLREFPVDALKIDRSFVSRIAGVGEKLALVRTMVRLGHDLGLEVVAEGIEDELQLELLRDEGCDTGQGYLFSRPLDPAALLEFVERRGPSGRSWG